MAEFLDSGTPGFVYAQTPNGPLLVDRATLGPADTIVGGTHATPATPAATPVSPPGAAATPMTAASLMAKRDAVLGAPKLELAGTSSTTSTQKGIAPAVLDPILAGNTARAEEQASTIRHAGDETATRKEGMAMADSTASYGRQQQAEADKQQAAQRAQIAHQNELALALQKDPEVDPDRFVRNMSTGQGIGTVILAALNGAFKGMVGQSGNDVMDILSKRVSEDLAAQREQIASGRVRRGNLISYFQNQGMREDAAVKAAEATSWAMLDRMVASERERIGAGQDRTNADVLAEQLKARVAERNDDLKLTLGTDRVSTQSTRTMQQKAAPAAGAGLEQFTKLLAARKAYEESGASPEELKLFDSTLGVPPISGQSVTGQEMAKRTEPNADQAKAEAAVAAIEGFATDAGLAVGDDGYRANPNDKSLLNARQKERAGSILPGSSQKLAASESAATEAFGRLQSGGVISPTEEERFRKMIGDATTDSQLAENLNAIMRIVKPRMSNRGKAASAGAIPFAEVK